MGKQTFFQGALILVAAGLVTKLMGFINRIVLSRIIGAEGMGLYQMAVPTLYLIITLTTFGLPVAISKMVAEAEAQRDTYRVKMILRLSLCIVAVLSVFFTLFILAGAPLLSRYLLTDPRAYYSLLAMTPIVPIVAVSSVLRGYFQGRQNMVPPAVSQVIEQTVRLFTVFFLARLLLPKGVEFAAAGAMFGIVVGEFCSMGALLFQFRRAKVKKLRPARRIWRNVRQQAHTLHGLLRICVPVTASRLIGSVTYAVEPIIVAQSLALAGIGALTATTLYGQLAGMAIPLLTFPTFFTYSLSVSLVPAIAEAAAVKNFALVHRRLNQALRIALVIGAPCTTLLFVFAEPLCEAIYENREVGRLLRLMAPFSLLLYFQGPLASALQGLDYAHVAMRNSVIGSLLKTGAIFLFAARPAFGIDGVAMAINVGIVIVTALHFASIAKAIGFTLAPKDYLKTGFAMVMAGLVAVKSFAHFSHQFNLGLALLFASLGTIIAYLLLIVWLKVIGQQDIRRIPWIGKQIAPLFPKR
ncbi:stage V sporulation protein B [Bacillaceae bacterium]